MDEELAKVRLHINAATANQKRPALLLQAIDATLAEQACAQSPTAYFASLLTTLQSLTLNADHAELIAAVLYLLAIVMPFVPDNVLLAKQDAIVSSLSAALLFTLQTPTESAAPTLKSFLTIAIKLYSVLPAQLLVKLEYNQLFNSVLSLLMDARPKVRRKAQDAVLAISFSSITHPYAQRSAEWVINTLENGAKEVRQGGSQRNKANAEELTSRLIGLAAFVKEAANKWPQASVPNLINILLTLPRLNNQFLTRSTYDILESVFSSSPDSSNLPPIQSTLQELLNLRPPTNAVLTLPNWLGALEQAFVTLARQDKKLCNEILFSNFKGVLLDFCSSEMKNEEVRSKAEQCCRGMIRWCLDPSEDQVQLASTNQDCPLKGISDLLEESLNDLSFRGVGMLHVLNITAALVTALKVRPASTTPSTSTYKDPRHAPLATLFLSNHVQKCGDLRGNSTFEYKQAAEQVIGTAVEICGPLWVLDVLPLNLMADDQASSALTQGRAWMLPLLRSKITNTTLKHFVDYFVPLSEQLFNKKAEAQAKGKGSEVEAKVFEALVEQVWALLPGFCDLPVDLTSAFTKSFAELLCQVLYSQPALRPVVFRSLQVLVQKNQTVANSTAPSDSLKASFGIDQTIAKANLKQLAGLAPNLLAVMFNVFNKSSREAGHMVLDCIATYVSIMGAKEISATYQNVNKLLQDALKKPKAKQQQQQPESSPAYGMLDLLITISPYLDEQTSRTLYNSAKSDDLLGRDDATIQKKAYRLLCQLCESKGGKPVLQQNTEKLLLQLANPKAKVLAAAKKDRTELLGNLVAMLPADRLHVLPAVLSEAVLATKENNEKTREAGYDLVVEMGRKMAAGGSIKRSLIPGMEDSMDEDTPATIKEYFTMVAAGLTSSPHMISATITALSRLIFEFNSELDTETKEELIATNTIFVASNNREIVKSAIGFVKVIIVALPPTLIMAHLPSLIPALLGWSSDHKNHFKIKIRHIFERLIRKFGYDAIERLVGEDDIKLVKNIRKRQLAAKRKKVAREEAAEPGDDEDMLAPEQVKAPQRNTGTAYEDALYGSESELGDDSDGEPNQAPQKGKKAQRETKGDKRAAKKREVAGDLDDGEEPLDLMGDVSSMKTAETGRKRPLPSSYFKTDKSGKMIIDEDGDSDAGSNDQEMGDSTNAYLEAIHGDESYRKDASGRVKFNKKRSRQEADDDRWVQEVEGKLTIGPQGAQAAQKKRKKEPKPALGSEFKAKKAGGDVKKNGVSPYAYVSLNEAGKKGTSLTGKKKGSRGRH